MGKVSEMMINGELCEQCGVFLSRGEKVFQKDNNNRLVPKKMPVDGSPFGVPVVCEECADESLNNSDARPQI